MNIFLNSRRTPPHPGPVSIYINTAKQKNVTAFDIGIFTFIIDLNNLDVTFTSIYIDVKKTKKVP
ncbi:hypothetical protein DXT63_16595 [Thermoanaerobacteraceae bacterium SP2]|jgi:hypothetical protein|nr:hypothetical protein DXT63_16595 [Thermoanaerobacteraceae bacterium SP2]